MDWERQNFSIAQCIFSESTQSNLVSISSASSSGSSKSSTVGIAVGVAVGVVVLIAAAIAAYFLIRRRRRNRQQTGAGGAAAAAKRNRDDPSEKIRQGFAKGELDTGHDNQRYEMAGSDPDQAAILAAKHDFPGWVNEKANYPGHREGMVEADGGGGGEGSAGRAELLGGGGHRGTVRPLHEMHDPSSQPRFELPVEMDSPGELHGSTPGSSAPASPVSPMRHSGAGAGAGPAAATGKRGSAGRGLRSPFSKPTSSPLSGQASSSSSSGPPPHHHHQSSPSAGGEGPSRPRSSFLGGFSRSLGGNRSSTASRGEQQQRNAPAASQPPPPPSSSSVSRPRNGYGPGNNNNNSASAAAAVDASPFSPVSRRGTFERSGTPTATTYSDPDHHYNYNNSHAPISPLQSPEADQQSHQQQGGSLWGRLRRS